VDFAAGPAAAFAAGLTGAPPSIARAVTVRGRAAPVFLDQDAWLHTPATGRMTVTPGVLPVLIAASATGTSASPMKRSVS
jgi:hypothetical protein